MGEPPRVTDLITALPGLLPHGTFYLLLVYTPKELLPLFGMSDGSPNVGYSYRILAWFSRLTHSGLPIRSTSMKAGKCLPCHLVMMVWLIVKLRIRVCHNISRSSVHSSCLLSVATVSFHGQTLSVTGSGTRYAPLYG